MIFIPQTLAFRSERRTTGLTPEPVSVRVAIVCVAVWSKVRFFPAFVHVSLLNVVLPDIVEVPTPSNTTVPELGTNVPPLLIKFLSTLKTPLGAVRVPLKVKL